jgi:hypothetical protein
MQSYGRNAGIAVCGKTVWQHLKHALASMFVGVDIDLAKLAIGAYVVHTAYMVVVGVGNQYAVDATKRPRKYLLAEIGAAVDKQPCRGGLNKY